MWDFPGRARNYMVQSETQFLKTADMILSFRMGFSRVWNAQESVPVVDAVKNLSLVPGRTMGQIRVVGLPDLGSSVTGISSILTRPRRHTLNDYQFSQEGTLIRGAHAFRFGGGYDRVQLNQLADVAVAGSVRFDSLADFFAARPRNGDFMVPGSDTVRGWRQHQFFFYLQDEWRAARRLNVTLGVRYETYTVPDEVNGKIATFRDPLSDPQVTVGGPLFQNPSRENFAPRTALAWDIFGTGKTVLRAGGGIFFDLIGNRDIVVPGNRMPPFFQRATPNAPPFPNITAGPPGGINISPDTLEFYMHQPYAAQFQLRLQQQIGPDTVVQIGYAGARGVHLMGQVTNANTTRPQYLPDGRLFFPANGPRMNPNFETIIVHRPHFDSSYHALILSGQRRFRHGVQFQFKYGWGKSLDNNSLTITQSDFGNAEGIPTVFNYRANRGPSDYDLRHDFAVNFSWQLPGPSAGIAKAVFGGWEVHGLMTARSGQYLSPQLGFDRARLRPSSSDQGQRPDSTGRPAGDVVVGLPERWFDPVAFTLPEAGFLGNLGRNTVQGPGLVSLDTAVQKYIWKRERHSLRLRVEAFNLPNRPNFAIPSDLKLFNNQGQRLPTAGRITNTTTSSRQIQLAMRFSF
jgi:hypothetical protein